MKANELRIGNLVYNPNLKEVRTLDILDIRDYAEQRLIKDFEPIPLTEEWLVKFRFVKEIDDLYLDLSSSFLIWFNDDEFLHYKSNQLETICSIKYVHQLQNLYFALTGEELTIGGQDEK
jgi:hypothetical protein